MTSSGQYGTWVEHPDYQYVFIPADVGPGWRPYQEGRWVWTDAYGWYWESYEPFGWATYHYGRWGYDPAFGWFWVPGDTWAPAWVTWRRGGGRTGWAPVAPDRPGYAIGRPDHYAPPVAESWVFVEDRYIAEENLAAHVAPIPEINIYLQAAPDAFEPRWNDGYYVNRGFGTSGFDAPVRERLVAREVYYVDRRDDIFYDGRSNSLGIFAPRLDFGARRSPPPRYVREIEPDRRPLIRQYVREDRDVPGFLAPSVALLNLLQPDRRRELRDRRFDDPDRYRREVRDLQRERADGLRDERRQAAARADALQRQQREALEKRRQSYEKTRAEQRLRAERALKARPAGLPPGGGPDRPGAPDAGRPSGPDPRPNAGRTPGQTPGQARGQVPGRPPGPEAAGTPQTRPAPGPERAGQPPGRPGEAPRRDGPPTPTVPPLRQRDRSSRSRTKCASSARPSASRNWRRSRSSSAPGSRSASKSRAKHRSSATSSASRPSRSRRRSRSSSAPGNRSASKSRAKHRSSATSSASRPSRNWRRRRISSAPNSRSASSSLRSRCNSGSSRCSRGPRSRPGRCQISRRASSPRRRARRAASPMASRPCPRRGVNHRQSRARPFSRARSRRGVARKGAHDQCVAGRL
ncbi:DUF6600 domain-containing protein [Ancylobacter dichloromethanicus]